MKRLTKLLSGFLAAAMAAHPLRDLITPRQNYHHATANEPSHIHRELYQPESPKGTAAAVAGQASAAVPFVDSNDWEQAAIVAIRSRHDNLHRVAGLSELSFVPVPDLR